MLYLKKGEAGSALQTNQLRVALGRSPNSSKKESEKYCGEENPVS